MHFESPKAMVAFVKTKAKSVLEANVTRSSRPVDIVRDTEITRWTQQVALEVSTKLEDITFSESDLMLICCLVLVSTFFELPAPRPVWEVRNIGLLFISLLQREEMNETGADGGEEWIPKRKVIILDSDELYTYLVAVRSMVDVQYNQMEYASDSVNTLGQVRVFLADHLRRSST